MGLSDSCNRTWLKPTAASKSLCGTVNPAAYQTDHQFQVEGTDCQFIQSAIVNVHEQVTPLSYNKQYRSTKWAKKSFNLLFLQQFRYLRLILSKLYRRGSVHAFEGRLGIRYQRNDMLDAFSLGGKPEGSANTSLNSPLS